MCLGNPHCPKEPRHLTSPQLCVFEQPQIPTRTHTVPAAVSFRTVPCGVIPMLRIKEPDFSIILRALAWSAKFSLPSKTVRGVFKVQILIKQCKTRNPTPRSTHTHSMHGFPGPKEQTGPPYLYHRFPSRPLVLSAPLCFASLIFSFPGLRAKHREAGVSW